MTKQEAIEHSNQAPTDFVVWMGDKVDVFLNRDEAFFYLGSLLRQGVDAYGHACTEGYVFHAGRALAVATKKGDAVALDRAP